MGPFGQRLGYISAANIKGIYYPRGITPAESEEALLFKDYFPAQTTKCCKFKLI